MTPPFRPGFHAGFHAGFRSGFRVPQYETRRDEIGTYMLKMTYWGGAPVLARMAS